MDLQNRSKVVTCLDGKERIFYLRKDGEIQYNIWKDGEPYGRTSFFKNRYPKFITKEMLFGSEQTDEEIINKEDIINEIAQLEARIKELKAKL